MYTMVDKESLSISRVLSNGMSHTQRVTGKQFNKEGISLYMYTAQVYALRRPLRRPRGDQSCTSWTKRCWHPRPR